MDLALEARDVTVRFGGAVALDGVTLRVRKGEIHGLAGPNGSGKTTLLNALSGFVDSHGEILLDGKRVSGRPAHRRASMGYGRTFQNPKIPEGMRVADLLHLGEYLTDSRSWGTVAFRPWRAARLQRQLDTRAGDMIETLGLRRETLSEPLENLSSGSLKMIDIARAIMPNPTIVALDEPTSGMNDQEIDRLLTRLRALRDEGMTVLMVEHNLRVLSGLCDTVTVLNLGRVLCEGSPSEAFARQEVVEAYLGQQGAPPSEAELSQT